ncbi:MAG: hypothetical protein B7X57_06770 [Erythrobacter sp. 34-65-8]|nr:MAG: hypothetical protein B7X57_06770 [Erythrobacter sp. 34-65-8]
MEEDHGEPPSKLPPVRSTERRRFVAAGFLRAGNGFAAGVKVTDISLTGARVQGLSPCFETGTTVQISFQGIGPLLARVRWQDTSSIGIEFERPLHVSVFDWLSSSY